MQILRALLLGMVFAASICAQNNESLFTLKGTFDFENPAEQIVTYRFFNNGARLWLLGTRSIQVWDVSNKEVVSNKPHGIENLDVDSFAGLSPDGSKFLYKRRKHGDIGSFVSIYIYDLNALKQLRIFDPSTFISGAWSKDGKTFYTVSREPKAEQKKDVKNLIVSFWDGNTLEGRQTIMIQDLDWWHLSPDGKKLYTTSVPTSKWLGLIPNEMANKATAITVWDIEKGQVEKTLSVGDENFAVLTWKMMPSPSGRYMVMISKHNSDVEEHKIVVWELNGSDAPKYSVKADPKLSDSNIRYSPDEKYFAVDSGKNIQVYELETGRKKSEILNTNLPDYWLNGDQILLNIFWKKLKAYSVAGGGLIYENPLIFESYDNTSTDSNGQTTTTDTVVTDQTTVVPHPDGKVFLTYSNKYVQVYKADTGALLETLVRPPLSLVEEKSIIKRIRNRRLVTKAGWSKDGKTLWVINRDKTAISLWDLKE